MLRTIIFLLLTLIAIPVVVYLQGSMQLNTDQWAELVKLFGIMLGIALTCFVVSEVSGNYSQIDKLWSILPIIYCWIVAMDSGWEPRIGLMTALATTWGLRLTFNFWRRGGYGWPIWQGEEDYRWAILRKQPHLQGRVRWGLFNLFFISLYQGTLILLFTLPVVAAWTQPFRPLNWLDIVAAAGMLGFILMETVADQQQWNFQTEKHRRLRAGEPLTPEQARGFCREGLWARMRHPNYTAEQSTWVCFYLFSVAATGQWLNWSAVGVVLLLLLFQGSANFSEGVSAEKYPAYKEYQKEVSRFLPF